MPADVEIAQAAALKAISFLRHYTGDDRKHAWLFNPAITRLQSRMLWP